MDWERLGLRINAPVFFIAASLIIAFVLMGALFTETVAAAMTVLQDGIATFAGWFYTLAVAFFLVFVIGLFFSRYGSVRLGPDDAEPEFSYLSWFAMLFSAGMGIGLLFFSVAEPVLHYASPPGGGGGTAAAVQEAMEVTFFHWGVHAWAIYIVVGLSLAYFSFRHDLPLTIRSALYPMLGDRIYGPIGNTVDIFAVLGTMFGVATSLGLGVMQVNAGLGYLFGVPETLWVQLALIAGITLMATVSVVTGLERGIRRLSEFNIGLGVLLVLFVFITGPTVYLLNSLVGNVGHYLGGLVENTFRTAAYGDAEWLGDWTLFYWGWWIAWSPFVGMFIARISRGRTIREFIGGVLLVPVALTFLWLTVFGNSALYLEHFVPGTSLLATVRESVPTSLYALLENFPFAAISSLAATLVVITFFVTSSDSGSLVIDIITAGGDPDPPVPQRIFWAVTEGLVAGILLVAGGLTALQTAAISSALPFTVIMLFICWGLLKGLRRERKEALKAQRRRSSRESRRTTASAAPTPEARTAAPASPSPAAHE
ncbi:MAG: BCCT family transporter [Candidatus Longimicrobiales bacterium M2_2A_002]